MKPSPYAHFFGGRSSVYQILRRFARLLEVLEHLAAEDVALRGRVWTSETCTELRQRIAQNCAAELRAARTSVWLA